MKQELQKRWVLSTEKKSEAIVQTDKKPTKLKTWIDKSGKKPKAGVNDVVFCDIVAVDENGTINTDYSEEISITLKGDVEIMNPDAIRAGAGIAIALIRVGESLNGSVSAKAKDLESNKFSF